MRGIPPSTMAAIDRAVHAGAMTWNDDTVHTVRAAARALKATLEEAATVWWMICLGYYEMITKRGIILHPRDIHGLESGV